MIRKGNTRKRGTTIRFRPTRTSETIQFNRSSRERLQELAFINLQSDDRLYGQTRKGRYPGKWLYENGIQDFVHSPNEGTEVFGPLVHFCVTRMGISRGRLPIQ